MDVPFWSDEDDTTGLWNRVILDDIVLPGLCRVRGDLEPDIEVKKSKGVDGADYTDNGLAPAKFQIEMMLWNKDMWAAYLEVLPQILPRKRGTARKAWEIYHPALILLGIGKAYITGISMVEPDDDGIAKTLIKCIEYNPAPKPIKPAPQSDELGARTIDPLTETNNEHYEGNGAVAAAGTANAAKGW